MAKVLITQPTLYYQGQVALFQGDRWTLGFQVVENYNGIVAPVDCSAASGCTAFFPTVSGGSVGVVASFSDPGNGYGSVVVPTQITQNLSALDPSSWFVQVQLPQGLTTIETPDQPLVITAPGFQ